MTRWLVGFAYRLVAATIVVAVVFSTQAGAQGLPGLKDFLERGYRIVGVVPDGARHVIYLRGEAPGSGSLVICFVVKNDRGIFNPQGCDHLVTYDRKSPGRR
jgi:hypothetical protein